MICTRAQLELRAQNYEKVLELLDEVLADARHFCPRDAKAHFLRGSAYNRLGRPGDALSDLLAAKDAGLAAPALPREIAYAYSLLAREHMAAGRYAEVLEAARHARGFSDAFAERLSPLTAAARKALKQQRPWSLALSLGLAYDDNVGLYPDQAPLPAGMDSQADGRVQFALDSRRHWQRGDARLSLGYSLFQSRYQQLTEFNLQNHTLSGDLRMPQGQLGEGGEWGLNLQYIYATLAGERYEQGVALSPLLLVKHPRGFSFAKLLWRQDRFPYSGLEGYDSRRGEGLYRFYLTGDNQDIYSFAGFKARHENTDDPDLSYHGLGLELGTHRPWHAINVNAELSLERRAYASHDDVYAELSLAFAYQLQDGWQLQAGLSRVQSRSDEVNFDYSRNNYFFTSRWQL